MSEHWGGCCRRMSSKTWWLMPLCRAPWRRSLTRWRRTGIFCEPFSPLETVRWENTFFVCHSLWPVKQHSLTHTLQSVLSSAGGAAMQPGQNDLECSEDLPHQHSNPYGSQPSEGGWRWARNNPDSHLREVQHRTSRCLFLLNWQMAEQPHRQDFYCIISHRIFRIM